MIFMPMTLRPAACQKYICIPTTFVDEVKFCYWKMPPIDIVYTIPYTFSAPVWMCFSLSLFSIFITSIVLKYDSKDILFTSFKVTFLPIICEDLNMNKLTREKWSKSLLLIMWLLMGALLIMAFQSNLLATLSVIAYEPDINTPEEVYAAGKRIYTGVGIYDDNMFSNLDEESVLRAIYRVIFL